MRTDTSSLYATRACRELGWESYEALAVASWYCAEKSYDGPEHPVIDLVFKNLHADGIYRVSISHLSNKAQRSHTSTCED